VEESFVESRIAQNDEKRNTVSGKSVNERINPQRVHDDSDDKQDKQKIDDEQFPPKNN